MVPVRNMSDHNININNIIQGPSNQPIDVNNTNKKPTLIRTRRLMEEDMILYFSDPSNPNLYKN